MHVRELYSWTEADGTIVLLGFLDLVAAMRHIRDEVVVGFSNPTAIIVVAHSHGTVWAHTALMVLEREGAPLPVRVLVDLDGVSVGWESDTLTAGLGDNWVAEIRAYNQDTGTSWPFDIADATDVWPIAGVADLQDVEDVVPSSVTLNLEVGSDSLLLPSDRDPNHRLDGSQENIIPFRSDSAHVELDDPGSDAMAWVTSSIVNEFGL
jgi:hypothetical protein